MWCTVKMLVSIRQLFGFTQEIRTCWPCSHCCWAELEVVCLLSVWLWGSTPAYLSLTPSHGTSLVVILSKHLEFHLIVQVTVNGKILLFKWTIFEPAHFALLVHCSSPHLCKKKIQNLKVCHWHITVNESLMELGRSSWVQLGFVVWAWSSPSVCYQLLLPVKYV